MEDKQLHLHGYEYMNKLLKAESSARLSHVMQYVELEKNYTVADFACGNAPMLNFLGQQVKSYYGVDFSPPAINNAESRKSRLALQNAHFQCGSIKSFCNENYGRFDAGFALDLSEHVCNEEWVQILSSIKPSLKKKANLYIHTPNGNFFLEIMKSYNFIFKQFPEHIAVRNVEENLVLLERAGYKIKKVVFLPHYNILKYVHIFSYMPWLGKYFQARLLIIAEGA
jgi:2-polyprenyl-6-hydroxyphenyl methylase / 3-demethylubiquinone-9 3-methyltransferase